MALASEALPAAAKSRFPQASRGVVVPESITQGTASGAGIAEAYIEDRGRCIFIGYEVTTLRGSPQIVGFSPSDAAHCQAAFAANPTYVRTF